MLYSGSLEPYTLDTARPNTGLVHLPPSVDTILSTGSRGNQPRIHILPALRCNETISTLPCACTLARCSPQAEVIAGTYAT